MVDISEISIPGGLGCSTNEHVNDLSSMPATNAYSKDLACRCRSGKGRVTGALTAFEGFVGRSGALDVASRIFSIASTLS